MSDTIIPLPKKSLERLLKPVNRLSDSCILRSDEDNIYTICSTSDGSVILYATSKIPLVLDSLKLNLINIKKLLTGLDCLGDDGEFKLIYKNNHILCKSISSNNEDNAHFKYHLVDDGIIKESPVKLQKLSELTFDTAFEISTAKIKQIMSAYSFNNEVNKIYFYTKDSKVYAEIDDKTMQNVDNVSLNISNEFSGKDLLSPMAVKIEVFKLLSSSKSSIKVKINNTNYNVFIFETQEDENTQLKYIISALVK
jgi:hypothetical protein